MIAFEGGAEILLKFARLTPQDNNEIVVVPASGNITSATQLKMLLRNMYADDSFADLMFSRLIAADPQLKQLGTLNALRATLKLSFKNSINWQGYKVHECNNYSH